MYKKVVYYHTLHSMLVLLDGNDTTAISDHLYILCHFANYAHRNTLYIHFAYSHPLNEHCTQLCSLHSLLHKGNPYLQCSAAIKFYITYSNILYHTGPTHALPSFYIQDRPCMSAMLSGYSNYIHCSHPQCNSLPMCINMHSTPSTTYPTAFHNFPMNTINKHKA